MRLNRSGIATVAVVLAATSAWLLATVDFVDLPLVESWRAGDGDNNSALVGDVLTADDEPTVAATGQQTTVTGDSRSMMVTVEGVDRATTSTTGDSGQGGQVANALGAFAPSDNPTTTSPSKSEVVSETSENPQPSDESDNADDSSETPPADPGGSEGPELEARLFPGWCVAGAASTSAGGAIARVEPGQSIQDAINNTASNGGGIVEITGRHAISQPLEMRTGVVLRGTGGAIITTAQNIDNMVQFGGGFGESATATVTGSDAFSRSFTFSGSLRSGYYIIGDQSRGQLIHVTSVDGNKANVEIPLAENFDGLSVSPQRNLVNRAGLESVTLEPAHRVRDLIEMRSTRNSWVRNVTTDGSGGQTRSAVYLRQAYRVSVVDNTLVNAAEHGDGGQGYGINVANNSSSILIANNNLRLFRHSMLLQGGAAGNVVRGNDSDEPRHPNFVQGGPADISFHDYASANLAIGNTVTRIQINDAGRPGPHNAILFNTLRTGPLTLDNGVDNLTLIGNDMRGSLGDLRGRTMPSLNTNSTAGNPSPARPYWTLDYDPFAGPGADSRTQLGRGILDWGSGDDVYIDQSAAYFDPCG